MRGDSPCIKRCELDNEKCYCVSCFRISDEIKNWSEYDDNLKEELLIHIKMRKEILRGRSDRIRKIRVSE